jgi:MSHA pilin protein MshD
VQAKSGDRARGAALADALMAELMAQAYQDSGAGVLFGREAGESTTTRSGCDDVDDYNDLSESPPQNKDGTTISNYSGWSRSVAVVWVSTTDTTTASLVESKVKRITVTVRHNGVPVAVRTAVRTKLS